MSLTSLKSPSGTRPLLALLASAALWGTTWYPFRLLAADGIDGLTSLALTEMVALVVCWVVFGAGLRGLSWSKPLLAIGLLGGACNTGYVIGAIEGEVMRVTLLLYLSPLWTVVLAHWLLNERLERRGVGVVALSLAGAVTMLWPFGEAGVRFSAADAWGLMAGISYAGYNVLVRRHLELSVAHKTFAGTVGCVVVAMAAMPFFETSFPAVISLTTGGLVIGVGALLVLIVVLMQFGLERMPASRASVIMVSELLFATLGAWWLADETPSLRSLLGGTLIVAAAFLATRAGDSDATAKA
jgi:drug/metabolite transporter (DMT)-like permease